MASFCIRVMCVMPPLLQVGFGSGFKCNSAVWKAVRNIHDTEHVEWMHMKNGNLERCWNYVQVQLAASAPLHSPGDVFMYAHYCMVWMQTCVVPAEVMESMIWVPSLALLFTLLRCKVQALSCVRRIAQENVSPSSKYSNKHGQVAAEKESHAHTNGHAEAKPAVQAPVTRSKLRAQH